MTEMEEQKKILEERFLLAKERIEGIAEEKILEGALKNYFSAEASFLLILTDNYTFIQSSGLEKASVEELARRNEALYRDILPAQYETSFANPSYAVQELGEYGKVLCYFAAIVREAILPIYRGELEPLVIRMELFLEIYGAFATSAAEGEKNPSALEIRKMLYWFVSDYADMDEESKVRQMVDPTYAVVPAILEKYDKDDLRFLYRYGLYVDENVLETARFLAKLPEEKIDKMADTFTEGYRIGFEVTQRDLSKKKTVVLMYHLGFERMMRKALRNFKALGLSATAMDARLEGGTANRQYGHDHLEDLALLLDRNLVTRKVEARRNAFETYREIASKYGGPAVVETFGEADFEPKMKEEAIHFGAEENKLSLDLKRQFGEMQQKYTIEEERSFTIISFPIPEVGDVFEELFEETIKLNTLDYVLYRNVQQRLIDALDMADFCIVKGSGDNMTDLKVNLWKLKDPAKETIFENCVADVNIPVGEVFTSPVLEGTNGTLHVSKVYLNGLEYRNLKIVLQDGMIADYSCTNFASEEENRKLIKEHILYRYDSLPIGEFAIGTNTTAFEMARRLHVEAKLPILIAEKTGPHFAMGDTCYQGSEDVRVYNPDGKEIVAKENSVSALRKSTPEKAYFYCHTDITIPYDELGELSAVKKDGTKIELIRDGKFVLPGTEVLNEPLKKLLH